MYFIMHMLQFLWKVGDAANLFEFMRYEGDYDSEKNFSNIQTCVY